VAPPSLPRIRWLVRQVNRETARSAAHSALDARTDTDVLEVLRTGVAACGIDPAIL
jgi:signal transduction protein with GAF and PtsI domain